MDNELYIAVLFAQPLSAAILHKEVIEDIYAHLVEQYIVYLDVLFFQDVLDLVLGIEESVFSWKLAFANT